MALITAQMSIFTNLHPRHRADFCDRPGDSPACPYKDKRCHQLSRHPIGEAAHMQHSKEPHLCKTVMLSHGSCFIHKTCIANSPFTRIYCQSVTSEWRHHCRHHCISSTIFGTILVPSSPSLELTFLCDTPVWKLNNFAVKIESCCRHAIAQWQVDMLYSHDDQCITVFKASAWMSRLVITGGGHLMSSIVKCLIIIEANITATKCSPLALLQELP